MADLAQQIEELGKKARAAARALALSSKDEKNAALRAMADAIEAAEAEILAANAQDVAAAPGYGLNAAAVDRLRLTSDRVRAMAKGVREVADLPDPCGEIIREWTRPNGMKITKIRVPIGVVGIIYESRPNVTADAAVLCVNPARRQGSDPFQCGDCAGAFGGGGQCGVVGGGHSIGALHRPRGCAVVGADGPLP